MGNIDTDQLLYVAGIGLIFNLLLFALTLLVFLCKNPRRNPNFEAATVPYEYQNTSSDSLEEGLNSALIGDEIPRRLTDLIPSMKFQRVAETTAFAGEGCAICLREGFEEEEVCKVLPECRHVFHSHCIDRWLKTSQSCPVCRKAFRVLVQPV